MPKHPDTFLSGANIDFIEGLYARFLEDPNSVDPSWRDLFEEQQRSGGRPVFTTPPGRSVTHGANGSNGHAVARLPAADVPAHATNLASAESMRLQARVDQTITAFRLRGHLLAQIDPLGRPRPPLDNIADVGMVSSRYFTEAELEQFVDSSDVFREKRVRLRDLLERLRRTYCHHIGVECATLLNSDHRRWLMPRMELTENHTTLSPEAQRHILTKLSYAEGFEHFLHSKYLTEKRFGLDGGESLIPMLDAMLDEGGKMGLREVVIGMAHRGRLNVLANILGKSTDQIFSEFEKKADPKKYVSRGDVKYHQGFSSDYETESGETVHLSLAFNPSHLEFVDPVVLGRVRAKQDRLGPEAEKTIAPVLIHGDAAFIGQGIVAETLNLARLRGYKVGGTIHIVINNQVGFTTDPDDSRSSMYATSVAQMLDIPIFHVNGDDPEACVHVMRLATQYRQTFNTDVVVDLVCFRRFGHNESDEPTFTQPRMYELIKQHPGVRKLYAEELARARRTPTGEAEAIRAKALAGFQESLSRAQQTPIDGDPSFLEGLWKAYRGGADADTPDVNTALPKPRAVSLLETLSTVPQGFSAHQKILNLFERRREMALGKASLDWAAGELLAWASLAQEGRPVRLTGQDTERGTFSHRNIVLHDVKTGDRQVLISGLGEQQAPFYVYNSPLSEQGCLGFEYGYSLDFPDGVVAWEAQFGDFANGAQVIIDQFVVAGEQKWRRLSGLVLMLPHGYEGQGPEHSSARLERFLELCGDDNIQVVYPTSSAQIFHVLRRQGLRALRKPLIIMTPKSLLRRSEASSPLSAFTDGTFQRVIPETSQTLSPQGVERLILCTGKVYFDLVAERERLKDTRTAIVRLEQLYPFPKTQLTAVLSSYPKLAQLIWVQEEPRNMGSWRYLLPKLSEMAQECSQKPALSCVARVESASPATGFLKSHDLEQRLLVEQAMGIEANNVR
ncbi:MAG: 2-oxoglutarate dehydrogenase E1 component [Myxococcaceae bacterium]